MRDHHTPTYGLVWSALFLSRRASQSTPPGATNSVALPDTVRIRVMLRDLGPMVRRLLKQ